MGASFVSGTMEVETAKLDENMVLVVYSSGLRVGDEPAEAEVELLLVQA